MFLFFFLRQVFTVKSRGSAPVTLASLRETSKETFQYFGRLVLAVKSKLITSVSKIEIIREKNGANFSENCQTAIRCSGIEIWKSVVEPGEEMKNVEFCKIVAEVPGKIYLSCHNNLNNLNVQFHL